MAERNLLFQVGISSSIFLVALISLVSANNVTESAVLPKNETSSETAETEVLPSTDLPSSTTVNTSTTTISPEIAAAAAAFLASLPKESELPQTIPDFIRNMMKKFGEAKAAEAFQSLDQLPLGLVMKILLVEMDKSLAADIVAMQRYAQTSDKALILMIGRIVAGDKNVPKEIFAMDLKLMKFPWWMRIRDRMLNNLEKYVAAYSLVPVASRTAANGANKAAKQLETLTDSLSAELAAAVAASATESSKNKAANIPNLDAFQLSLLNPFQQQQLVGALSLSQAASSSSTQAQQLLQQTKQATNFNPFSLI